MVFPAYPGAPESRSSAEEPERAVPLAGVPGRSPSAETPAGQAPARGAPAGVPLRGTPRCPPCSRTAACSPPCGARAPQPGTTISLQRCLAPPQQPWAPTCPGPRSRPRVCASRPGDNAPSVLTPVSRGEGRPSSVEGSGQPRKAGFPPFIRPVCPALGCLIIALPTFDASRPRHSDRIGDHFCHHDKPIFSICRLSGI